MLTKRSWIVALGGLNVLLAALMIAGLTELPTAHAQAGARAGDFVTVTAKAATRTYDVLFLVDVPGRKLHAMYPANPQTRQLVTAPPRNLAVDFGR